MRRRSFLGLIGGLPVAAVVAPEALASSHVSLPPMSLGHVPARSRVILPSAHAEALWPGAKALFRNSDL